MLVENLHEPSLVAQRMVFDSIKSAGGVMGVVIDKHLLQHVRGARSRAQQRVKRPRRRVMQDLLRRGR